MSSFLSTVLASAVGFVVAKVATAYFDAYISKASSLEDERDADAADIKRLSQDVASRASDLWSKDYSIEGKGPEALIVAEIAEITRLISELFDDEPAFKKACETELSRFDEAVTGGLFGSVKRVKDLNRLQQIHTCGLALSGKVATCRRKLKPHWFGRMK